MLGGIARKKSSTMPLARQGEAAVSNRTPFDDLQFAFQSDEQVAALASSIDTAGFGVLEDAVSGRMVDQSRHYIEGQLRQHGGQYFGLAGNEWIEESPLAPLARSPQLECVLKSLYYHAMGELPPERSLAPSLRVLAGTVGLRHSYLFHYDSYVVTALVPLLIPDEPDELPGDLLLYPNMRRIRRSAIVNILEKVFVENSLACRAWRTSWMQRRFGARVVKMKPGNIYFFWGIRSLHANEACLVTSIRSTALFHYGDPHAGSFLKRLSARRHQARLRRLNRGNGAPPVR
jgi:hypothetical protein